MNTLGRGQKRPHHMTVTLYKTDTQTSKSSSNVMANFSASSNMCLWRSLLSLGIIEKSRKSDYIGSYWSNVCVCVYVVKLDTCFQATPLWSIWQQQTIYSLLRYLNKKKKTIDDFKTFTLTCELWLNFVLITQNISYLSGFWQIPSTK